MTQLPELSLSRQNPPNDSATSPGATPEQQRRFGQQAAARMLSFHSRRDGAHCRRVSLL